MDTLSDIPFSWFEYVLEKTKKVPCDLILLDALIAIAEVLPSYNPKKWNGFFVKIDGDVDAPDATDFFSEVYFAYSERMKPENQTAERPTCCDNQMMSDINNLFVDELTGTFMRLFVFKLYCRQAQQYDETKVNNIFGSKFCEELDQLFAQFPEVKRRNIEVPSSLLDYYCASDISTKVNSRKEDVDFQEKVTANVAGFKPHAYYKAQAKMLKQMEVETRSKIKTHKLLLENTNESLAHLLHQRKEVEQHLNLSRKRDAAAISVYEVCKEIPGLYEFVGKTLAACKRGEMTPEILIQKIEDFRKTSACINVNDTFPEAGNDNKPAKQPSTSTEEVGGEIIVRPSSDYEGERLGTRIQSD